MSPPKKTNLLFELSLPLSFIGLYRAKNKLSGYHNMFSQQPVVILPGLGASDRSTRSIRSFLRKSGLWVYGWKQGYNHGRVGKLLPGIINHIISVSRKHKQPVILIGWSLGGLIAREVTRQIPEHIKAVCCMGSPLTGGPKNTLYASLYKRMGHDMEQTALIIHKRESVPLVVPSHILYSKRDGIVHWEACLDQHNAHTTHQEVRTPHFSMGTSAEIYCALGDWLKTILQASPSSDQIENS
jgi:hypothetical protein